jgi:DNA gyrase subunit A
VTDRTGPVAIARVVPDTSDCEVFIISAKAQVVRINLEDVRVSGRATQGVIIWRDREPDDHVASVTLFEESVFSTNGSSTNGHQDLEAPDEAE